MKHYICSLPQKLHISVIFKHALPSIHRLLLPQDHHSSSSLKHLKPERELPFSTVHQERVEGVTTASHVESEPQAEDIHTGN